MPAIRVMFDYNQNSQYHQYDLWMHCVHTVLGIDGKIEDDMLFLIALLHNIGKPLSRCKGKKWFDIVKNYFKPLFFVFFKKGKCAYTSK